MSLPPAAQRMNDSAEDLIRAAMKAHPENPVGLLVLALMRAGRDAGMAAADVATVLTEIQRRNPRPI